MIRVVLDFSKIDPEFGSIDASAMVVRTAHLANGDYGVSVRLNKIDEKVKPNLNYKIFKSMAYQKSDLYSLFYF